MVESFAWKVWPWISIVVMGILTQWIASIILNQSGNSNGSAPDASLPGRIAFGLLIMSLVIGAALSILILYAFN